LTWLRNFYHQYIQTAMGFVEIGAGLLEYIDMTTVNLVGGFLGPKWGPIFSKSIQIGAGLMTAYRAIQVRRQK
jgi:hypothetical protein